MAFIESNGLGLFSSFGESVPEEQIPYDELLRKRKSRREILNDLSAKGIDRDTAADVVEELFAETDDGESPELETARALVQRQYAAKLAAGKRDQVAAALARRGFPMR